MPVHLDISRLDRLVMVVVIGEATGSDFLDLARQFTEADMIHYRKIINITAGVLAMDDAELASVTALLRADPGAPAPARLAVAIAREPHRAHAVRVHVRDGEATPTGPSQGSHVLSSLLDADGLVIVPAGPGELPAGAEVEVLGL